MSLSFDIADWRGENKVAVGRRILAARYRRGESLERWELLMLRRYCEENGNGLLVARIDQEMRAEREEESHGLAQ